MGLCVDIYGTLVSVPEKQEFVYVENWGTDNPKEQKWRRKDLPDFFNVVEYDKQGNLLLTKEQEEYATEEVKRCKQGFFFLNNGKVTYITGKHYFYLMWWKLEDDIHADYRDTDRRYFMFLAHWEAVLWCLGIARGKKRREGASSQATANLMYECIFFKNSFCGLVSKSNIDSRDTFTDMVSFGYRQLPPFLKPIQLNNADSVTELVFSHKSTTIKGGKAVIDNDSGHRSKVNYRAPAINAFDRGRLSRGLFDEGGKWPKEVPFAQFISIVSKTMIKGAKRVGFAECPSTVNEMTKQGGAEFKVFWDGADQFKSKGKPTKNGFVRYFTPAYDGYEGFIDEYGMSVIGEPTLEQYQYLVEKWVGKSSLTEEDIKLGAKAYLEKKREGLSGSILEEAIRQDPFDEVEMFMAANTQCVFNSANINKQRTRLADNPPPIRRGAFQRDKDGKAIFKDDPNGFWEIIGFPPKGEANKLDPNSRHPKPGRTAFGVIGVDGYSNEQGGRKYGSHAAAYVYRKYQLSDPNNTGLFEAQYYGRPSTKELFHNQILMAGEYYGYEICYEHTADDYMSHYKGLGKIGYLMRYPVISIEPSKREKTERFYGFPINPFAMTKQLDTLIAYIDTDEVTQETYCDKIYFDRLLANCLVFEADKRTAYDCVVAAMIALVAGTDIKYNMPKPTNPLIQVFENKNYMSLSNGGSPINLEKLVNMNF